MFILCTFYQLRFSGFDDEWIKVPAGEIFKNVSNKNHDGTLPILAVTQDKGVVPRDSIDFDIKTSEKSVKSYKIIEPGDYVISLRSFQGGIEYSYIKGICSPAYTVLKPKKDIFDDFYKFYLKKDEFISRLNYAVIGIRDGKQISYKDFSEIKIPYTSVPEQKRISEFLNVIDSKITLLEKKYENYINFKKYLMQQIFAQKLRFDFKEEWENVTLNEVAFIPKKTKLNSVDGLKLLTVKLHAKGIEINDKIKPKLTKRGRPYYIRQQGELLIGRQNFHNGGMGIVPKSLDGGICSNAISSFKVFEDKIDITYLYYFLSREEYYKKSERLIGGTGQKEFSEKELLKLKIDLPSLEEQKKIIKLFLSIDNKINGCENQLNKSQEFKKGLLQQMFV